MISELSTGFPGYDSYIGPENATVGRILRGHGYATSWFGKNHNTPGFQYAGPYDQWPSGMGFDYFYGFLGGESDQWTPYLFRDHTQIFPWIGKPGYNLTTDLADEAVQHMRELNATAPDQPFFVYYVPGGSHSPHQPTQEWIDKFKGKFDMGWNAMRDEIYANQKRLGVIPADAELTPWPDDLPKWESLSADEKKLFARQAEVFAAYTAYTDHEIGRVIQAVEDMEKLDNTLIIYICGDNGTTRKARWSARPISSRPITDSWTSRSRSSSNSTTHGDRRPPTHTWRWPGPGPSTRRSNGPSRSPPTSAEPGKAWRSPGRPASRTLAAFAPSSTTSSILSRPFSKPRISRHPKRWMGSRRTRSKA